MKKVYYLVFVLLLTAACKKSHTVAPLTGTIVLAPTNAVGVAWQTVKDVTFSAQDSATAVGLMKANNLSTDGFVFYTYEAYNALDQNNQMGFYQIQSAMQVRNGLPVFLMDVTFAFENGKLNQPYPTGWIVGTITLDNKPNLTLTALRDKYIQVDNASEVQNISIGDSTLVAQLGYYNLNINQLFVGGAPNYIKAWYVHPQHSALTLGYFRDDNGAAISFKPATHNGVIFPGLSDTHAH